MEITWTCWEDGLAALGYLAFLDFVGLPRAGMFGFLLKMSVHFLNEDASWPWGWRRW